MKNIISIFIFSLLLASTISCNSNKENGGDSSEQNLTASGINQQAGEKYIADQIKNDKSFIRTESGLCYKILNEGEGENFKETDLIDVIYVGKHINGNIFDSSNDSPVPLSMQGVVPGFKEILSLMKPGAKAIAIIPGNLAYGENAPNDEIGPNETLVFEINTVGIHQDVPVSKPVKEETNDSTATVKVQNDTTKQEKTV